MKGVEMLQPRIFNTCDDCRARKVRCLKAENPDSQSCMNCTKRRVPCHFSVKRRRARQTPGVLPTIPASQPTLSVSVDYTQDLLPSGDAHVSLLEATKLPPQQQWGTPHHKLYIDHLLENRHTCGRRRNESSILKAHDNYVGSSGLAFFSEKRIASISDRLGHTRLRDHIETLATAINSRMNRNIRSSESLIKFSGSSTPMQVSDQSAKSYIRAYFNHVHPVYPFLDRNEFEEKASSAQQGHHLQGDLSFLALYHTVLALGCQYQDGGTFDPGEGMAWKLYQISLGLLSDILVPKEALVNVQAITAMAIFAHNSSCLQIGNMLTAEAARMAQLLGFNKATCHEENEATCYRTFWVIYILEKTASFACSKASVLADYDIGSPIPETPDAVFQGFDWFFTMARFSRLISRAYEVLFSISATLDSTELSYAAIDSINDDLERWRKSIPEGFRPGDSFQLKHFLDHSSTTVALRVHYHYYSLVIALSRMSLHVDAETPSCRKSKSKNTLMNAARVIIELTRYIDTEAHAPIWILGSMPLSALFILFDFVVHNPAHPETKSNISLLGVVAGYFCRLEYASSGSLPTSLLSDFAHIARQYVQDSEFRVKVRTDGGEDIDRPSGPFSLVEPGLENPPLSVPVYNYGDETRAGPSSVDSLSYPVSDVPFPMVGGLPDGIDIMDFFDNIMVDYRNPIEWVGGMQEAGT
ncbi:fungal-specific transcription factor domain-containing protein [Tricladium varicosporioides]|nr:fungal-specific transcription factor domain-containing protein [Hymenoscyphus varicosporioides]